MPVVEDDEELAPVPRRARFEVSRTPWWRPRSTFGRVLLGSAVVLVLGSLTALGIVTRRFLVRDPHFRIGSSSSIQSTGLSEVNRAELLPVFGEDIGRNIFFVPLSDRRKQLEAIPWVQQATVMRFLPDRLSVSIVERTPVAFVRQGNQIALADADGVILTMPPAMMAQHHYSFPVITGINAQDPISARRARMAIYRRFVSELDQSGQHLTQQVSEIDLSDPEDLRAVMPEQGADILAHFGEDQFLKRLQIYKSHIGEWRGRYPKLIGVDLRYNGEVPLEMATDAHDGATAKATIAASGLEAKPDTKPDIKPQPAKPATKALSKPVPSKAPAAKQTRTPAKLTAAQKAAEAKKKAAKQKATQASHQKAGKPAAHPAAVVHKPAHSPTAQQTQGQ